MRAVGVDLGTKRIGVAICDAAGTVATPYETIARSGNAVRDRQEIARIVEEVGAEIVVVGLPISLDGRRGPAADAAAAEAEALAAVLPVPVELHDERLTTVSAERSLRAQGVKGPRRRQMIDQVAAAVMLQAWLERRS